ncbi:hypothetical protein GH714_028889 [Hevea brasiliensis]|uniref:DYW domain-containing protein n=1 Tax=Hevea brasiliensis TaxID=3981 RepID=A0A6A6LK06_HEVBR|nr:hypothetical protein GH714_028889 [Hevea brasiliensis]
MGEWIIGALINLFGSIAINFGTNLLKLGHTERERHSTLDIDGTSGKSHLKPIIYFQTWRVGILFFFLGNCLNFISFGYAAQSLLAALGSVQFVSNIAFAYFVLNKMVTVKVLVATAFIVLGNVFLVAFGNHQSPVYTPEQLAEKYSNMTFLFYCMILVLVVALHHYIYRRGELLIAVSGQDLRPYWQMLLPFSYAVVSGAVGSCSMTRLNEGLSLFDAILIVPMFQIVWTFFSICTGFVYFQEYQVFDALRTTMFILGMMSVFIGISLLAPDESRGAEVKDNASLVSIVSSSVSSESDRIYITITPRRQAKHYPCFGEDSINASAVLVMPMVSSKITGKLLVISFQFRLDLTVLDSEFHAEAQALLVPWTTSLLMSFFWAEAETLTQAQELFSPPPLNTFPLAPSLTPTPCSLPPTSDPFLWNVMIRGFVDHAQYHRSVLLYIQMLELGIRPNNYTFPFVIKACGCLRNVEFGIQVHDDVVEFGYESDVFVCNSLIVMYGKCERYELSRQVFDRMPDRNETSWSTIIRACSLNGHYEKGCHCFGGCCSCCINGFDFDQYVHNAALGMYARCGRIDLARSIFDGILNKDIVTWASMIEAYAQADLPLEALGLFKQMNSQRIFPDSVTLLSVVRACSVLASFRHAHAVHGIIILTGGFFNNPLAVETAVIDLYTKCGSLTYARKVFDRMQSRNIITWSAMISGYGMHGLGGEAYNLFNQMKSSVKPDHIAFVSILSACSHSGRAGKLDEAQVFIERMPIGPDAGVWGALLGACRVHSNIDLAEMAAKALLDLDSKNPGRYVLLSNIYASSGKTKDAHKIRTLMMNRGVRKVSGHTIIEIKNKVYTFVAGDRSHPQTDLIYSELERVMDRIRQEGYTPDMNFVLHDVEEETKEKMLYVHSEKLAIVFGLLNSRANDIEFEEVAIGISKGQHNLLNSKILNETDFFKWIQWPNPDYDDICFSGAEIA